MNRSRQAKLNAKKRKQQTQAKHTQAEQKLAAERFAKENAWRRERGYPTHRPFFVNPSSSIEERVIKELPGPRIPTIILDSLSDLFSLTSGRFSTKDAFYKGKTIDHNSDEFKR